MIAAMRHERSYTTGAWSDESAGVYVGWSVRNSSRAESTPLSNARGDIVLIFSGDGAPKSDDEELLRSLNGLFHGLRVDRNERTALLFNDRYGMHRLYYHAGGDAFYFAAEAKAILAVRSELRQIDETALGELITCGCVLGNKTLFKGIHVLPGASAWLVQAGTVRARRRYFDPQEWERQPILKPHTYYGQLRDIFSASLQKYFEGPDRVAMSLTGGLDTRMIMAWQRREPGALPTYTFGGPFRECADVRVARRVARTSRQPHQVIAVGRDFLAGFAQYAERTIYLSDGGADVSRSPDLYLNEQARHVAPVRLTGNYGGEVLRRVRAFKPVAPLNGLFAGELQRSIQQASESYAQLLEGHPLSFAVFRQAPWHHYGLLALEQTQLSVRTPFLDNEFVRTVFTAPDSTLVNDDTCLHLIADGNPAMAALPTDRGWPGRGPWMTIRRAGIELTRKAEYAYDYGMPQTVAAIDHLVRRLRPERLFLGRHKFAHFRVWYRDQLSRYVQEVLLDERSLSRPYLERRRVEAVVTGHVTGRANYTKEIHKLLTLELVHRLFVDAQALPKASRLPACPQPSQPCFSRC